MSRSGLSKLMCVYRIWDTETGLSYVGSTVSFRGRVNDHRCKLKYGRHHALRLQAAYSDRPGAFRFEILETVQWREALHAREQWWIDLFQSYRPGRGYNESHYAGLPFGPSLPGWARRKISEQQKGRVESEETRRRRSVAQLGKRNTPEHTLNISRGHSLFVGEKLDELLDLRTAGLSCPELAKRFGCDRHTVRNALKGKQLACAHVVDPIPLEKKTTGRFPAALSIEQRLAALAYLIQGVSARNVGLHLGVSRGVIDNVRKWADKQDFPESPLWWTAPASQRQVMNA